jgi:hypothetical protein
MGWAPMGILGALNLYIAYVLFRYEPDSIWFNAIVLGISVPLLILFWSLTVRVDDAGVEVWFSRGFARRRFRFTEIDSASSSVTFPLNFGIRFNLRGDEVYRVSGGDELILNLRNGTKFTIGTHDAVSLAKAINSRLPGQAPRALSRNE